MDKFFEYTRKNIKKALRKADVAGVRTKISHKGIFKILRVRIMTARNEKISWDQDHVLSICEDTGKRDQAINDVDNIEYYRGQDDKSIYLDIKVIPVQKGQTKLV